jgi:hypothetical protein
MTEAKDLFSKFVVFDARMKAMTRARRAADGAWKSTLEQCRLFSDARSMAEAVASVLTVSSHEVRVLGRDVAQSICELMPNVVSVQ